jgi:hypothetical protein
MDPIFDKIDTDYLREMARILGTDSHVKTAAAKPFGTKAEEKKEKKAEKMAAKSGIRKMASMNIRELLENPDFRRGVFDEIEARRNVWEPLVIARSQAE